MRRHLTKLALSTLLALGHAPCVGGRIDDFTSKCRGLWESVFISPGSAAFRDATTLYLRVEGVYVPEWVKPRPKELAELKGEFVVVRKDGKREALADFYPLRLEGPYLQVGTLTDGYTFRWALTNDLLVLGEGPGDSTSIELRRISANPGRPELAREPAWVESWRRLYWSLVGEWRSVSMTASNFHEFASAAGMRLVVMDLGQPGVWLGGHCYSGVYGELYAVRANGWEFMIYRPNLISQSPPELIFGIAGDGFSVRYSFEDGLLVLRRKIGTEYLEAKLKRARTDPAPATPGENK